MKLLITYVTTFCFLLIVATTLVFREKIDRVHHYGPSIIKSLALSMEGIDTDEFNRQHQPYLDYLGQK